MGREDLVRTLEALADQLVGQGAAPVEILLVGGAGGLLAGYLPSYRTTRDCDVMVWTPDAAWPRLVAASHVVAGRFDLPNTWLENASQVFRHRLLPGWEERRETILEHAPLTVRVPSRVDFIAMKTIAARDVDLDDVLQMKMTADEHDFIRGRLSAWPADHFAHGEITLAIERLDALFEGTSA